MKKNKLILALMIPSLLMTNTYSFADKMDEKVVEIKKDIDVKKENNNLEESDQTETLNDNLEDKKEEDLDGDSKKEKEEDLENVLEDLKEEDKIFEKEIEEKIKNNVNNRVETDSVNYSDPNKTPMNTRTYKDEGDDYSEDVIGNINPIETKGLTKTSPSEKEIKSYWFNYKSNAEKKENYKGLDLSVTPFTYSFDNDDFYEIRPNIKNKEEGRLKQSIIDDTVHIINTIRMSAGLGEVHENKDLSVLAQKASFINHLNDELTHYPRTPENFNDNDPVIIDGKKADSSSNIAEGYTVFNSIKTYMDDENDNNKKTVGHRKWLLNPNMKEVGVGQVGFYSSTHVASDTNTGDNHEVIAWPSTIAVKEFVHTKAPFSVSFGNDLKAELENAKVKITDDKGNIYNYSKDNGLYLSLDNHGRSKSIIFGDDILKKTNNSFNVEIEGVKINGVDYPITYNTKFISIKGETNEEEKEINQSENKTPTEKNEEKTPKENKEDEKVEEKTTEKPITEKKEEVKNPNKEETPKETTNEEKEEIEKPIEETSNKTEKEPTTSLDNSNTSLDNENQTLEKENEQITHTKDVEKEEPKNIKTEEPKKVEKNIEKKNVSSPNVKTGVTPLTGIASLLTLSSTLFYKLKKRS